MNNIRKNRIRRNIFPQMLETLFLSSRRKIAISQEWLRYTPSLRGIGEVNKRLYMYTREGLAKRMAAKGLLRHNDPAAR